MKYIKLHSLTWWASFVPLVLGVLVASTPLHGLAALTDTINNLTGFVSPAVLINAGLLGVGFRGAIE
jgi:hypothetical protein